MLLAASLARVMIRDWVRGSENITIYLHYVDVKMDPNLLHDATKIGMMQMVYMQKKANNLVS